MFKPVYFKLYSIESKMKVFVLKYTQRFFKKSDK